MTAVAHSYQDTTDEDVSLGVGPENDVLKTMHDELITIHFFEPISRQDNISYQFFNLVEEW